MNNSWSQNHQIFKYFHTKTEKTHNKNSKASKKSKRTKFEKLRKSIRFEEELKKPNLLKSKSKMSVEKYKKKREGSKSLFKDKRINFQLSNGLFGN